MEVKTPHVSIQALLSPDGPFAKLIPKFSPRRQQVEMVRAVETALRTEKHLMVEAGTGVGKSFGYLLPAVVWAVQNKKKVVVATYTKALQEQLVQKDLPVVQAALKQVGLDFQYALLMGSENYLCLERLDRALSKPELFDGDFPLQTLNQLRAWSQNSQTGLKSKIPFQVNYPTWEKVCRDADLCLGRRGAFAEKCLYRKDLTRARQADLVVINQHLFFAGRSVLKVDAVVFDEAHNLADVASHFLGFSVSSAQMKRLYDDILNPLSGRGLARRIKHQSHEWMNDMGLLLDDAKTSTGHFFELLRLECKLDEEKNASHDSKAKRVTKPLLVQVRLSDSLNLLGGHLSRSISSKMSVEEEMEVNHMIGRCQEMSAKIDTFLECEKKDHAYWIEVESTKRRGKVTSLNMVPLDIATPLKKDLFERIPSVILTSATLAVNGSFKTEKSKLGLEGGSEALLDSPFNYESQSLLYTDAQLPDPRRDPEGYEEKVIQTCLKISEIIPGGIFILFTNWSFLNKVYSLIKSSIKDRPLFKQGEAPPFELVEKFKQAGRGILFGTDTFWQGVDVPGTALSCVVLTRLPFSSPTDPLEEARQEWMTNQGKDIFEDHTLPEAIMKFRQGFGRLIRSVTDRGVVAVLDPRIRTKPYGSLFLNSIPRCRRVETLTEIKEFFNSLFDALVKTGSTIS